MFEVPGSKADDPANRFEFTIGGETFSVPLLQYLDGATLRVLDEAETNLSWMVGLYALFGSPSEAASEAVHRLHADQLDALWRMYREASDISAGESSASTDS